MIFKLSLQISFDNLIRFLRQKVEEDGQPDDQLVAREHIERAQQQRNETDPVGLVAELVSLDASLSWMLYPLII